MGFNSGFKGLIQIQIYALFLFCYEQRNLAQTHSLSRHFSCYISHFRYTNS